MSEAMTPAHRVWTALGHQEPDRVPVFLPLTMHGAKELGLSLPEYYARPTNMVEAQLRLADRFGHDCLYAFGYAAGEAAAFGCEVAFFEDGPPGPSGPAAGRVSAIVGRPLPDPARVSPLKDTLAAIRMLSERNRGYRPIVGVVMAPFSLPIMLLGLETWIRLLYEEPADVRRLLAYLTDFCVAWANSQLAAGANALAFFDPMASVTLATPEQFEAFGLDVSRKTIGRICGPCVYHFASGRAGPALGLIPETGAAAVAVGSESDLAAAKCSLGGRLGVFGALNGIEMIHWSAAEAEEAVKACIAAAGRGGGYVLGDQHGEVPHAVPEETLHAVVEAARRWGRYPLAWAGARV